MVNSLEPVFRAEFLSYGLGILFFVLVLGFSFYVTALRVEFDFP